MKIKKIKKIPRNNEPVYNLTVADNHNYFVNDILVSNCHTLKTNTKASEMIHNFETNIRLACTATLPNEIQDRWELIGLIGPVLFKKSVVDMIEDKFVSDLNITSIHVHDKEIQRDRSCLFSMNRNVSCSDIAKPYADERDYIAHNIMKLYAQPVEHVKFNTMGTNTLWLFDFIEFGKALYDYIKSVSPHPENVYYIDGTIDVKKRDEIIQAIENGVDVDVVAQSVTFNTGINSKNLHNIVFVFNSKSDTKIMQSIGRGLRKHNSKSHFELFDINFNFKYSQKHHKHREKIYKKEYNRNISTVIEFKV